MNMLIEVKKQLLARKGQWRIIANDADVGYQWLTKLMQGKFDDPGVKKIENLYNYFKKSA